MKKILRSLAILSLVSPSLVQATLLEFAPSTATADLGGTVAINIVATPENGELIGAYAFIVNFDPSVLALSGVVFGASLNDDPLLCNLFACRGFLETGGGVEMFEAASPFTPLGNLQDGIAPVILATLLFDAVGVGTSGLSFTGNVLGQAAPFNLLGDEFGIPLPVFEPGVGRVTVAAVIPEPPSILLLLMGLLALLTRQRFVATVPAT